MKLALLAVPVIFLAATNASAENQWGLTPYVGADAEWRHINFQKGQGDNLFRHDFPQGNIYAGLKFNDFFAIEGGFESTTKKSKTTTISNGDSVGGVPFQLGQALFTSNTQVKGLHANAVGFLPICDTYRLQLIGMVGFARLNESSDFKITRVGGVAANVVRTFKQRKSVLRLGAGVQHNISENWGVRAMVKWENTNRFNINAIEENSPAKIKGKNSLIYGFGAFMTF